MSAPAPIPEAPVLREGETLAGRFQVVRPFSARSRSGCRFATFDLDDGRRTLRAYAWESDCQGFQVPRHRDRVYAAGRIRWRNARFELVCRELRVEDTTARIQWAKGRLREVVRALEPCLREFLRRLFSDPDIATAFLASPASLNRHHAAILNEGQMSGQSGQRSGKSRAETGPTGGGDRDGEDIRDASTGWGT